jgi:hypothetical protein
VKTKQGETPNTLGEMDGNETPPNAPPLVVLRIVDGNLVVAL